MYVLNMMFHIISKAPYITREMEDRTDPSITGSNEFCSIIHMNPIKVFRDLGRLGMSYSLE